MSEELESPETPGSVDEGPGCLPGIMAATVLMGIFGFVTCAFSTWFLFQQRTEFALRTLRGSLIPQVEQGLLHPETKTQVIAELTSLADDLERGKYENWQAAGAMTRLISVPINQWGEIHAIEAFLANSAEPAAGESRKQLSRLLRAVETGKANSIDFERVLEPVRVADPEGPTGYALKQQLNIADVSEVAERAKLVADRAEVANQRFEKVSLVSVIRRAIERGVNEGT